MGRPAALVGLVLCVGVRRHCSTGPGPRRPVGPRVPRRGLRLRPVPRMLTTLGPISIEAWPSAVAPWVLLPLVMGAQRGSPRRMAAARRGWRVAMVGGVNAAATFAVLPLGVVWLLTRTPGPRRRRLMLWWPIFTLLGTLWWLVPLVRAGGLQPAVPGLHRDGLDHHLPDDPVRCAAGYLGLGPVRRLLVAGRQRDHHQRLPGPERGDRPDARTGGADGAGAIRTACSSSSRCRWASCWSAWVTRARSRAGSPSRCTGCSTDHWRRSATCTSSTR